MKHLMLFLALLVQFTTPLHVPYVPVSSSGPIFDSTGYTVCSFNTTCTAGLTGTSLALFVKATDLAAGNTISSITDSAGTLVLCTGFPQTFAGNPVYLYKEIGAAPGSHTINVTWANTTAFPNIAMMDASNVSSNTCSSTLFNTASVSSTTNVAGASFTNTANALALCFISLDVGYTVSSSGSTFTMTDEANGTGIAIGQGSIPLSGTNNCSWNVAASSTTNVGQTVVVLQ